MTSKLTGLLLLASTALALPFEARAELPKEYQFKGVVTKITPDVIELRGEREGRDVTLQFSNSALQLPRGLKAGDQVTVYYRLDAQKIRGEGKKEGQEPGQLPSEEDPAKKGIIRDDRAFYDARNETHPSPEPEPGSRSRLGG